MLGDTLSSHDLLAGFSLHVPLLGDVQPSVVKSINNGIVRSGTWLARAGEDFVGDFCLLLQSGFYLCTIFMLFFYLPVFLIFSDD